MRAFTFKEIIKIIPLEGASRGKLLKDYDGFDDSLKVKIQRICWNAFAEMREQLFDIALQGLLTNATTGGLPRQYSMRQQADILVERVFEDLLTGKAQELEQLREIREKLKALSDLSQKVQSQN